MKIVPKVEDQNRCKNYPICLNEDLEFQAEGVEKDDVEENKEQRRKGDKILKNSSVFLLLNQLKGKTRESPEDGGFTECLLKTK